MASRPTLGAASAGLCLASAGAVFLLPFSNPDLFWHLSAARWIVAHRAVPRFDWLSWTMPGAPWVDFEWGAQLAWLWAYARAGVWGLLAVKAGLLAASGAALWRALGLYGLGPGARGAGVLAWALALMPSNDLRPENFSVLLFGLEWLALEAHRLGRADLGEPPARAAAAAAFAVWANLHPGFFYGLALGGLYAVCSAARGRWSLVGTWATALAATTFNPYGLELYGVAAAHAAAAGELRRFLREWGSPALDSPYLFPFWAALVVSWLAVAARSLQDRDAPLEHVAALAFASVSAARHARTAPYLAAVAVPAAARALAGLEFGRWRRLAAATVAAGAAAGGVFMAALVLPRVRPREPFWDRFLSARAARFLKSERGELGGKKMLNPWHWGGYLGWALYPDYKVFVDGRYLFHPLLEPMRDAKQTPESYARFLETRGIELVLLERARQLRPARLRFRDGAVETVQRPMYLDFLPPERWALVYWDPRCLIFVRRDRVGARWLDALEYRVFRPDDGPAGAWLARQGKAAASRLESERRRAATEAAGGPESAL